MSHTDQQKERILTLMRSLALILDKYSKELIRDYGVSLPQMLCLEEMCKYKPQTMSTLAQALGISRSNMTVIIDKLEKLSLVKRKIDKKNRLVWLVDLTPKGREFVKSIPKFLDTKLGTKLDTLTQKEQLQIANSLELLFLLVEQRLNNIY